ncbi:sugar phosphate isomerase/epimerase [Frigidibacter sp. RF13]|uniref:sugar phosphate isomerase/epimerase family protein n=1 Tax=Frigidibacter sp. RF13 TaxID=2997340 RepID=UPI002271DFF0|nr:sugar phosphate isomerase/epimerase family protein [Frigidibacter sp. RF13]MCY1125907.1 sugar phosphate isomerase/epimerase [Frigidibacter sp. RF13]
MSFLDTRPRYAVRLNAFRAGSGEGFGGMVARAAGVPGIDAADLNFPDHLTGQTAESARDILDRHGIGLNGLAMRYGTDPAFRLGAFTHPDRATRQRAIDLTKRGIDFLGAMGGGVMTLWLGQDGVDYPLQADFERLWEDTVAALAEVAGHDPRCPVAVEYKPDEPRARAVLRDAATVLLALAEVNRPNLGVALDFAHALYAGEDPGQTARLIARKVPLFGVHLNDGYAKRDDGLMVGSVHPVETVGLFLALDRIGYEGTIYFDTFPDHGGLDPAAEAAANVAMAETLRSAARRLRDGQSLTEAQSRQDAAAALAAVRAALLKDQ